MPLDNANYQKQYNKLIYNDKMDFIGFAWILPYLTTNQVVGSSNLSGRAIIEKGLA